eukprot:jgi/Chrzof1/6810/Cz19g10170.t1
MAITHILVGTLTVLFGSTKIWLWHKVYGADDDLAKRVKSTVLTECTEAHNGQQIEMTTQKVRLAQGDGSVVIRIVTGYLARDLLPLPACAA